MVTKQALNKLTANHKISIQEAVHEIEGLDLVICSDHLTDVSLNKAMYLRKQPKKNGKEYLKTDLVDCYKNRKGLKNVSLETYFYEHFRNSEFYKDETTKRVKHRILLPRGLNCRPKYPVDYNYARGMIIMHKPWSKDNTLTDLLRDHKRTTDTFFDMIREKRFPYYVLSEYHRAIHYSQHYRYECIAKQRNNSGKNIDIDQMDEEELAQHVEWEHSCHLSAQNSMRSPNCIANTIADIGIDHDWSESFFKEDRHPDTMKGEEYIDYLRDQFYGTASHTKALHVPKKKDGTSYKLDDLNTEQQAIVICAMEAIIKFLTNDPTYKPLRATVMGCGGTGKSFIINTLISIVRNYTKYNESVRVAAPSGGAAYNVGGCTLHRCLNLDVDPNKLATRLSDEKQQELAVRLEKLLMLIIDERSMLGSPLLAAAERNIRDCAFGQQNQGEKWGGIPVVLVFGDDYQLAPVAQEGAITGFAKFGSTEGTKVASPTKKAPKVQLLTEAGHMLFVQDLVDDVFHLKTNYRSREDPAYAKILDDLRYGITDIAGGDRFMRQCMHHHDQHPHVKEWIENWHKTIYLYTKNYEKNEKNMEKLVKLSSESKTPVARLSCKWHSLRDQGDGLESVSRWHFDQKKLVLHTDLCVGARTAIHGMNFVPEAGLYNGARGTIVDIVYDAGEGPNNKQGDHLPRYIVVDFPGLKLEGAVPWDKNHPTVSK